jgi:hypothetical protein
MITSDARLLACRELGDTLGLTDTGADGLADARTSKNGRHRLDGILAWFLSTPERKCIGGPE